MWVVADLDEDYITKMEDVLELYERPYDQQEPVVCLDEKPITLHADVRPASPAAPGREARRDNEYERCGTANVFCAVEPKAGRHFTFPTPDRSGFEWAGKFLDLCGHSPYVAKSVVAQSSLGLDSCESHINPPRWLLRIPFRKATQPGCSNDF
jgi:hypothetical protein